MKIKKKTFLLISKLSAIILVFYFLGRIYTFWVNGSGAVNIFFAFLLLFAEGHSILQSTGYIVGTTRIKRSKHEYRRAVLDKNALPEVTVMVPARNEPADVLEQTFISLVALDYENKNMFFLDGSDEEFWNDNKKLVEKYNINYFRPQVKTKSKAEIINIFLKQVYTKYISVFDADQEPMPEFLMEMVRLAEYSEKIGFIQTPQLYSNINISPIAKAAALQQSIFFEGICESKGSGNAMFCCGTNFLMRTAVLKKAGGFDESSVTEDFSTSIKIHSMGYSSVYYPHVRVFGMAPETLGAYFKQQFRWASGTVASVRKMFNMIFHKELHFTPYQFWEYFLSATYYFTGWSFLILMICPPLYLIFGIPSYFSNPYFYLGSFLPYYIFTLLVFYTTMKERSYNLRNIFRGMTMGSLNFPLYIRATTESILGKKISFQITDKSGRGRVPFWQLWPWTAMIAFNVLAVLTGLSNIAANPYAITVNIVWCVYHIVILSGIYGLNKSPKIVRNSVLNYT